jgi:hypothetical protein
MKSVLICLFLSLTLLSGCSQEGVKAPAELSAFIDVLKKNGVDGSLLVRAPFNENMEYVAEYAIARFASTRIITFFKFKNAETVDANLQDLRKNDKLSGQASNGTFIMAATFYPPDDEAVEKIKALFLAHEFD